VAETVRQATSIATATTSCSWGSEGSPSTATQPADPYPAQRATCFPSQSSTSTKGSWADDEGELDWGRVQTHASVLIPESAAAGGA